MEQMVGNIINVYNEGNCFKVDIVFPENDKPIQKVIIEGIKNISQCPEVGEKVYYNPCTKIATLINTSKILPKRNESNSLVIEGNKRRSINSDLSTSKIELGDHIYFETVGKYAIKNETTDIKIILDNILDNLKNAITTIKNTTVIDPISGPLPLNPVTISQLTTVETNIDNIKNNLVAKLFD